MSTFIWGKIKLNKKTIIDNFQRKNIVVYFSYEKKDLFLCDLEENEIYFNIACGYDEMVNLSSYKMNYLNCDEHYFSINALKKTNDLQPYFEKLFSRILDLQDVIEEIFNNENVKRITYYHTDDGNENSIDDYESVDWKLAEFAEKFFAEILKNKGFTPTIKVVFNKNLNRIQWAYGILKGHICAWSTYSLLDLMGGRNDKNGICFRQFGG